MSKNPGPKKVTGKWIVCLGDGETWSEVDGCQIMFLTNREYEEMNECGEYPKNVESKYNLCAKELVKLWLTREAKRV
jgi:hypothetical protein